MAATAETNASPPWQYIIDDEKKLIEPSRKGRLTLDEADAKVWCGLSLSGGGIRSACVALGVLQALAEKSVLAHFDYLSSVSGGGYLNGSLQWWWSPSQRDDAVAPEKQIAFGVGPDDFPYGPARPKLPDPALPPPKDPPTATTLGSANLSYLRAHGWYLIGDGLAPWSMFGVVLRTVLISLLTWIPLLAFLFCVLKAADWGMEIFFNKQRFVNPLSFIPAQWIDVCADPHNCGIGHYFKFPAVFAFLLYVVYAAAIAFVCAAVTFALTHRGPIGAIVRRQPKAILAGLWLLLWGCAVWVWRSNDTLDASMWVAIAALVLFGAVNALLLYAEFRTTKSLSASYYLRRGLEALVGRWFITWLSLIALALIPVGAYLAYCYAVPYGKAASGGAVIAALSGVASSLYAYYTFIHSAVPKLAGRIAAVIGAVLYLYVTLLIAYFLSLLLIYPPDGMLLGRAFILITIGASICLAALLCVGTNINYVGLHRFYRDRLMEAFMPTDAAVKSGRSTHSPRADTLNITELAKSSQVFNPVPYPLVNTNVILINDKNKKVASRGGDNFIISPLYVGCAATGWCRSEDYIKAYGPLTLATAVAASGAAASASAGYIGTGITLNPIVAAAMSALNIRLGLWVGNPQLVHKKKINKLFGVPTFLRPGLSALLSRAHKSNRAFVELTDGGHFENLGLYELVRRKLDVIVVVDGEADPKISLSSFVSATHRIEQDFGATLDFFEGLGPSRLMMYPDKGYPADVRYAQAPFLVAKINYQGVNQPGVLIYIKSTLIRQMDFKTSGYLAGNPAFPHQSTVDQFFDPDQFDAYRFLGYESGLLAIKELDLAKNIRKPSEILSRYEQSRPAPAAAPRECCKGPQ